MTKVTDIKSAITLFQEAAIKHAEATEEGDYKTANKSYDLIAKAVTYLKKEDAIAELKHLICNSSAGVRLWAACYLLPITEKESISILEEISKSPGILALDAETTISEWKKGNLNF